MRSARPAVLMIAEHGGRGDVEFASFATVWPRQDRVEPLVDRRTEIDGRPLAERPERLPSSAVLRGGRLLIAPVSATPR